MYRYDKYDQAIVDARVDEFRDQVRRRIALDTEAGVEVFNDANRNADLVIFVISRAGLGPERR